MLKITLVAIVALSFSLIPAFAEPTIEVQVSDEKINALDSILVSGKITEVTQFKPVKIFVNDPEGFLVFAPQVEIDDNGEFQKLINPPVPSFKAGVHTVIATHEDLNENAKISFVVIEQELPRNEIDITEEAPVLTKTIPQTQSGGIIMSADAVEGSDTIKVFGNTSVWGTDLTLIVSSPKGNIVSIDQITPGIAGAFETEIKTGGPLWKDDGIYTITANQGSDTVQKQSIQVEIKDGVVVPEFGVIVVMVLAVAIFVTIIVSSKSKLNIITRY